jgi:hypothetical protein
MREELVLDRGEVGGVVQVLQWVEVGTAQDVFAVR